MNWSRIEEILTGALERDPEERGAYLDQACAGDATIRAEVDSLLAAHERPGAVDRMAADFAPVAARLRTTAVSLVGKTVGPYEVKEEIGGGAMGVVYRALDTRLGRTVALKFLRPHLGTDDSASERFRLEARTVGGLVPREAILIDAQARRAVVRRDRAAEGEQVAAAVDRVMASVQAAHPQWLIQNGVLTEVTADEAAPTP